MAARRLKKTIPKARFRYRRQLVYGEVAFLRCIDDDVDTFVIRDGRIVMKTVPYTVSRAKR